MALEKALEKAFVKVAQEESQDLSITNTIKRLNEQEAVVKKQESIGSRAETASDVSCAHHYSCRKKIVQLQSENQAIKIHHEKIFSFLTMEKTFAHPPYPPKDPPAGSACCTVDVATEGFLLPPRTDSRAEEKKKARTK